MENINFSHIWVTESPKEIEKIFEEIKEVFFFPNLTHTIKLQINEVNNLQSG